MIVVGVLGLIGVVSFFAWVVFREPWLRDRGDPLRPHAHLHAEDLRQRRRVATGRALDRLRDARDALDAVARSKGRAPLGH